MTDDLNNETMKDTVSEGNSSKSSMNVADTSNQGNPNVEEIIISTSYFLSIHRMVVSQSHQPLPWHDLCCKRPRELQL